MSSRGDWRRVSKRQPCPVCGKPDWCAVATDGTAALCQRVESSKRIGDGGWLHRLQNSSGQPRQRVRTVRVGRASTPSADLARLAERCRAAVDAEHLQRLARTLGLSTRSLSRLDIGWVTAPELERLGTTCRGTGCWTFPMRDAAGAVLGIRLRAPGGCKYAIAGSCEGLFVPADWAGDDVLLICEGPTDTAALLDVGFGNVVGRPSCTGGTRLLGELVRLRQPPEAVIVSDADAHGVGQRGADALAARLVAYAPAVRVIQPPEGVKDARSWLQAGGTRRDVQQVIDAAAVRRLRIRTRRVVHG